MRLLYWLRRFLGLLPPVQWADGVVTHDLMYGLLYAQAVAWVRSVRPDAVQSPDFRLTVRIYDRWPKGYENNWGKILPPNTIAGDTGGTLCLAQAKRYDADVITHELKHAITGISDHPDWLFPNG